MAVPLGRTSFTKGSAMKMSWMDPVSALLEQVGPDLAGTWSLTATASRCAQLLSQVPGEEEDPRLTMAAAFLRIGHEMLEPATLDLEPIGIPGDLAELRPGEREQAGRVLWTLISVAQGRLSLLEGSESLTREQWVSVRGASGWVMCASLTIGGLRPAWCPCEQCSGPSPDLG